MTKDLRWSKFWWKDWSGDPLLSLCSPAARGVWMDMLCIASEGSPYGHVTFDGKPATINQLAKTSRVSVKQMEKIVAELRSNGVFSTTEDGTIYSRRMVKDKQEHEVAVRFGKDGGNPTLKQGKPSPEGSGPGGVNPPLPLGDNQTVGDPLKLQEAKKLEAESTEKKDCSLRSLQQKPTRQPKHPKSPARADPDFLAWYALYPRKKQVEAAAQAWASAMRRGVQPAEIMAGMARHQFNDNPDFDPYPATWLNKGAWEDEPDGPSNVLRIPSRQRAGKTDWMFEDKEPPPTNGKDPDFNGPTWEAKPS